MLGDLLLVQRRDILYNRMVRPIAITLITTIAIAITVTTIITINIAITITTAINIAITITVRHHGRHVH